MIQPGFVASHAAHRSGEDNTWLNRSKAIETSRKGRFPTVRIKFIPGKIFLFVLFLCSLPMAEAQTINASSCSSSDVQSALNQVSANGATVVVPSGSCTWTSAVSLSSSYSFTLQGQSTVATTNAQGNPGSFKDSTLIIDGRSSGNTPVLSIVLKGSSSQVVRITGISLQGGPVVYNGDLLLSGNTGQARLDHSHFIDLNDLAVSMYEPMTGVADHNLFDAGTNTVWNGIRVYNMGGDGYGDTPWTVGPGFGTSAFIFMENNTFNNGFMNDCEMGGAFVARYNTYNVTAANQNIGIQSHATGSQPRGRGCRAWEVYDNVIGGGGGSIQYSAGFQTSGTGLWWGNTVSNSQHDIAFNSDRDSSTEYSQTMPPNGWGYCGSVHSGTASGWDQNTNSGGYACLDQIGRGQGDMLSGYWPNVQDNSHPGVYTGSWPNEVLQPAYIWMESYSGASSLVIVNSPNGNIQANRDYYAPVSPFTGATGTGYGTSSAMPSTCTTGVGYWATDKNEFYTCTATNTWTPYYSPYTYPHPLVGSSSSSSATPPIPALTGTAH